jgi:diguanylate cyclase (GGDEF)-like protein
MMDPEKEYLIKENQRLKELYELDILHEEPDAVLQEVVEKTAKIFDVPITVISIVLESRQWFKSHVGLPKDLEECRQTPREVSFCTHVVESREPLVITNAFQDERFSDNSLVTQQGFHFYAGVPLMTRNKNVIGTLCVYDYKARQFFEDDIRLLSLFADRVMAQFELKRDLAEARREKERYRYLSIMDTFLDIYNRQFLMDMVEAECRRSQRFHRPFTFLLLDVDHFKKINDQYGHMIGDHVLQDIVKIIKASVREVDIIGRFGGDELAVAMPEADAEIAHKVAGRLKDAVASHKFLYQGHKVDVTVSIGISSADAATMEEVLHSADQALYKAKGQGRNQVVALKI